MRNKDSRLEAIKMVVSAQDISSQEELLRELKRVGFKLTQATLSRDLRQLKVAKATTASGKYIYTLPASPLYRRVSASHLTASAVRQAGALSVKFSGNLAVVHTLPGHASHIAYDIDNKRFDEILGTLAGDDTILLVLAEGVTSDQILMRLAEVIPDVH
ncbi:arginine repressor [Phocaeicola sartorii]|uniref:arginine repressor n=1 Tax=Phocaeicola sartorii TaxID=671267 RepID=UPI00258DDB07|nr:arginine repressor [Phocaeicola sartorii]